MGSAGDYQLTKLIGEGTHGNVHLAYHCQTLQEVVLKEVPARPTVSTIRHPYLVELLDVVTTPECTYIVTEYCTGGAQRLPLEFPDFLSSEAQEFIQATLAYTPEKRLSFSKLLDLVFFAGFSRYEPKTSLDEVTQTKNKRRIELEEGVQFMETSCRNAKLGRLAMLIGVLEGFTELFGELEELRIQKVQ